MDQATANARGAESDYADEVAGWETYLAARKEARQAVRAAIEEGRL